VSGVARSDARADVPAEGNDEVRIREADAVDRVVRAVFAGGLTFSSLLLMAGFVVWLAFGGGVPASVHGPIAAARDVAHLKPVGFFSLGLLVLILTPFARVVGTLAVFIWQRDWRFVLVVGGVLAGMTTALVLAAV
jgi:uncharacterized membrane protein